jgi:ribosomal protein S18 acetylase RimI-like enzyme
MQDHIKTHQTSKNQTSDIYCYMLHAAQVSTDRELKQILALQQQNLRGRNNENDEKEQGFVTVAHTLGILQQMHSLEPSVIVKDNDILAGYALVMPKECSSIVPELFSLFEGLDKLRYKNRPLGEYHFYVMGQICVAREYRGKGVFDMLYKKHQEIFQKKYDFVVTQIATRNTRSLRAHERVGFKTVKIHTDELDEWAVVVWDWI